MIASERLNFLLQWIADPFRVASVTPSGKALSAMITQEIGPDDAPIIELGPGTGVFTQELIDRGIPQEKLILIEYGSDFARLLDLKFPSARVLWMDASSLGNLQLFGGKRAGAIVSGLPLLSMRPKKIIMILRGAFSHLRESGAFYQFTYGYQCPIPRPILDRFGLKASRVGTTLKNLPPASVYRITRRAAARITF